MKLLDELITELRALRVRYGNVPVRVAVDAHSQTIHGKPASKTVYDLDTVSITMKVMVAGVPFVVLPTADEFAVGRYDGSFEPL